MIDGIQGLASGLFMLISPFVAVYSLAAVSEGNITGGTAATYIGITVLIGVTLLIAERRGQPHGQ